MARYIDADAVDFSPLKNDFDRARAKVIIMGQPTADVVLVVRCKDCVYCDDLGMSGLFCIHPDDRNPVGCRPDDYCNNGERWDNNGE